MHQVIRTRNRLDAPRERSRFAEAVLTGEKISDSPDCHAQGHRRRERIACAALLANQAAGHIARDVCTGDRSQDRAGADPRIEQLRSEEHTSELQSLAYL